jgi:hypothetical protein
LCRIVANGGSKEGEKDVSNGERHNRALIVGVVEGRREVVRVLAGLFIDANSEGRAGTDDGDAGGAVDLRGRGMVFT